MSTAPTITAEQPGAAAKLVHWFCTQRYFKGKHRIEGVAMRHTPLPTPSFEATFDEGFTMLLRGDDVYERSVYFYNCELQTDRFLRDTLRPGMTFFDCGANLGYFTLLASRLVDAAGRVVAFEPTPSTYDRLVAHVETNGFTNVDVRRLALGSTSGTASVVAVSAENHGMNAVTFDDNDSNKDGRRRLADCDVRTVDDLLAGGLPAPDVMKIDVEGWELRVLEGAETLLRSTACPSLIVELCDEPEKTLAYLQGLRPFHVEWLDPRGPRVPVSANQSLPHYDVLGRNHASNYVFTPVDA